MKDGLMIFSFLVVKAGFMMLRNTSELFTSVKTLGAGFSGHDIYRPPTRREGVNV
jgi:hypothetical protein